MKLDKKLLYKLINEAMKSENLSDGSLKDMLFDFKNPENVTQGINLYASTELGVLIDDTIHNEPNPDGDLPIQMQKQFFNLVDTYVFVVDSKEDAIKLQNALRGLYDPLGKEIYVDADWYDGQPKVMMDVDKA
jgi:hypothetical protein